MGEHVEKLNLTMNYEKISINKILIRKICFELETLSSQIILVK